MGKCKFSKEWLCDPKYKDWLARDSKWAMKAKCTLCVKSFDISKMGVSADVNYMISPMLSCQSLKDGLN